jgi:hypothetical protein
MSITQIKPSHKAILAYYDAKKVYDSQQVSHEARARGRDQHGVSKTEFDKGLGDEGVTILDPCTGHKGPFFSSWAFLNRIRRAISKASQAKGF